jgi:hypothetical protein
MVSKAPNPKKRTYSAYDKKPGGDKEGGRKDYGNNGGGGNGKSYGNNGGKSYGNDRGGGGGGGKSWGGGGGGGGKSWGGGGNDYKGKGKFPPKAKSEKDEPRRKRPITSGGGDEPLDYDEVQAEEYDAGEDVDMGGEGAGGEPAEKKPRMTKTEKAAVHAAQPHRTTLLPSHPLLQDTLLPLWETARRTDTPKEERTKAVRELYAAVKGRILEISKGHKGGRVLQTVSYPWNLQCTSLTYRLSSMETRKRGQESQWNYNPNGVK